MAQIDPLAVTGPSPGYSAFRPERQTGIVIATARPDRERRGSMRCRSQTGRPMGSAASTVRREGDGLKAMPR